MDIRMVIGRLGRVLDLVDQRDGGDEVLHEPFLAPRRSSRRRSRGGRDSPLNNWTQRSMSQLIGSAKAMSLGASLGKISSRAVKD
jgi:hypothetical protein